MAAALESPSDSARLGQLRDQMEQTITAATPALTVGATSPRLPNTSCLALPFIRADTQLIALDMAGFAVSAGAACSSGKVTTSHVLTAMGLGPLASNALRVSLPWNTTAADITAFTHAYVSMAKQAGAGARLALPTAQH
jgi:cysteine desulfurase